MKSIFLLILFSCLSTQLFSQWEIQNFPDHYFNQVYFLDANTGFAVANNGKCLRTDNGGATWTSQQIPTSKNLLTVAFLKGTPVGIIGGRNVMLSTVDYGLSWNVYREWGPPSTDSTYEVYVSSKKVFDVFINRWAPGPYPYNFSTYQQIDLNFSEREIFSRSSRMYKIMPNPESSRDNYAYAIWAQEFNPFGAANILLYFDKGFNQIGSRSYANNYGLFDLISPRLFYNSYSQSHSNGFSMGQHLLSVSTGKAVSEFFFEAASNWNGHYTYTLRGISYNAGGIGEDLTNSNDVYIVGANEVDRDNPKVNSCIKRLNLLENRLYPEFSADIFLTGFTSSETALFAWSTLGYIVRKVRDGSDKQLNLKEDNGNKKIQTSSNYPNPFNPTTTISYSIPIQSKVSLVVYDITGRKVAELVNEFKVAGEYQATFNAGNLSSGIYFYTLTANGKASTKKMMLIK